MTPIMTIGIGTRIFLGGAQGFVAWHGTQHNPDTPGDPRCPDRRGRERWPSSATSRRCPPSGWWAPVSWAMVFLFMSASEFPSRCSNEEMARYTAVKDQDIYTQIYDYSMDYPAAAR